MKLREAAKFNNTEVLEEGFLDKIKGLAGGVATGVVIAALAGAPVGTALGWLLGQLFSLLGLVPISTYVGVGVGFKVRELLRENINQMASRNPLEKLTEVVKERDKLFYKMADEIDDGKEISDLNQIKSKIERLTQEQKQIGQKLEKSIKDDHSMELISNRKYNTINNMAQQAKKGKLTTMEPK